MKRLFISALMIAVVSSSFAQEATKPDNKPQKGDVGIWYGVSFVPVTQNILITGYATKNIEVGGSIGLGFSRSSNSTFENTTLYTGGFNSFPGQIEHKNVNNTTSFNIAPMVLYHFNIKSNVDLGLGANVPIQLSTGGRSTISDITTADNYKHTDETASKYPLSIGGGVGLLLSCKYFFYRNLAIGALGNLGFSANSANGHTVVTNTVSNSGANNPDQSLSVNITSTQVGSNNQSFNMLHNFALNLSWYFGSKKSNKSTN